MFSCAPVFIALELGGALALVCGGRFPRSEISLQVRAQPGPCVLMALCADTGSAGALVH